VLRAPIKTEADVDSLHKLEAGVLRDGPKVVTVVIDMRGDLPLDWNSRVSSIFFRDSGLGTVRTAGSWLTMQPVSPRVLPLLAALEPRMLRSGAVEYPRASAAEVNMLRDLLSEYLGESSAGKGLHDSAQYNHSVGVSELERSVGTLLTTGIGPITPSDMLHTACALRLCLMVRKIGHGREARNWLNVRSTSPTRRETARCKTWRSRWRISTESMVQIVFEITAAIAPFDVG
jgi:hypothetical protein